MHTLAVINQILRLLNGLILLLRLCKNKYFFIRYFNILNGIRSYHLKL